MTNSISSRKRNRVLAAILLPVALLLSACEVKADWTINTDKTVDFAFLVDAPELAGLPDMEGFCPSMKESFESSAQLQGATVEVNDLSTDGSPKCEMVAKGIAVDNAGSGFAFEGDKVTVTIDGSEFSEMTGQLGMLGGNIKFSMTFTFPGAVSEASVGAIDGNKVTISNVEDLAKGVTIVASMSSSGVAGGGNLIWILLAVGGLVIVGGVVAVVLMNNKKKAQAAQAQQAYPMDAQAGYPAQPMDAQAGYPAQPMDAQAGYPAQPSQPMPPQQPYPPQS